MKRELLWRVSVMVAVVVCTNGEARDLQLRDGTILKDVRVLSSNSSSVNFRHAKGIVQIPLNNVPKEVLEELGLAEPTSLQALRIKENRDTMVRESAAREQQGQIEDAKARHAEADRLERERRAKQEAAVRQRKKLEFDQAMERGQILVERKDELFEEIASVSNEINDWNRNYPRNQRPKYVEIRIRNLEARKATLRARVDSIVRELDANREKMKAAMEP